MSERVKPNREGGILAITRHGKSQANVEGRWGGRGDYNLANPQGYNDADTVAGLLIGYGFHPDKIFTSTLSRTRQMTAINIQELTTTSFDHGGMEPKQLAKPIEVIPADELVEKDFGEFTGVKKDDIKEKLGEAEYTRLRRGSWETPMPGGESDEDLDKRVSPYIEQTVLPQVIAGEHVLLVVHSNVARATLRIMHDLGPKSEPFRAIEVNNDEVHLLKIDKGGGVYDQDILRKHPIEPVDPELIEEVQIGRAYFRTHSTELDS